MDPGEGGSATAAAGWVRPPAAPPPWNPSRLLFSLLFVRVGGERMCVEAQGRADGCHSYQSLTLLIPTMVPPPGIVEVRCAGCAETLEVEHGLTEFACPDCGTAQALPPELMPRRPRRALPLPRRGAPSAAAPSRVACGGCGAILSVPHGQGRFACPLCGAELAASPAASVSVVAPPAAVPITPSGPAQPSVVRAGPSSQSTHAGQVQKPIHSGQTHGQHARHSFREESFSSFRTDTRTKIPVIGRLRNGPGNPSSRGEESHTEPFNETISRPGKKKSILVAGPESFCARKMQDKHPNQDIHASVAQGSPSTYPVYADKAERRLPKDTVTTHSKQTGYVVVPSIIEHEQIMPFNHVDDVQQAGETPNNVVHIDQAQAHFISKAVGNGKRSTKGSKGNQKRKNKSSRNFSNEFPHLRRSKRLIKGSPDVVDTEPIQVIDASPNQNQSEAPQIERTLADPDPSSPAWYQFPRGGSNELDDVDATAPPALNHGVHQAEQFPHIQMCTPETRWARPVPSSNSWQEHEIPQESFSGIDQLDRGYEEVRSNPSGTQNQDMDEQITQEACSDKNHSGQVRLKRHNENLSEHGRQKGNGLTGCSSNDMEHAGDWTFSGTCRQTNLSASCSRLTAFLPFPAATTFPTTTSPYAHLQLNCRNPALPHQQPPSPQYTQEAPPEDVLPGSISSKKRRGRAPEKLMEPRKEADRPVLTPSGTDWNVHPPCPKVANTLSLLIKQNYPGTYVSVDSGNGQLCEHVVYHWHQCPSDIRAIILDEFLKRYKWSSGQEERCQKIFDRKAVRQLVNLFCYEKQRVREELAVKKANKSSAVHRARGDMELEEDDGREDSEEQQGDESAVVLDHEDPLNWKPFVPGWMKPKWWEMLCDHWAKDEVMKVSYQKRMNRNSGKHPCNTAGKRSIPMHQQLVGIDNGGKVVFDIDSPAKIANAKGESLDQKDATDQHTKEAGGTLLSSHPVQGQVGSWKRGRYCGAIGILKKVQNESLSKSPPGCMSKQGQQPMFNKEQVQEMINQALQRLNEVWEKKFLSLEQKMPRISPSYIVPDVAKESLAPGRNKQCQLAQEDTLDSGDGEKDPAARDDGDYQDEEEHSS